MAPARTHQPHNWASPQDGTLDVEMVRQSRRDPSGSSTGSTGSSTATLYDYEYELNSTRGRKRILNSGPNACMPLTISVD